MHGHSVMTSPSVRDTGAVNGIGLYWVVRREVRRFLTVWLQTVLSPVVVTLLFLAIFVVVLGKRGLAVPGASYLEFIAPGMVMMTMLQNAFANTSSSIPIAKVSGTIADVFVAPLTAVELTVGYALGACIRGLATGVLVAAALAPFGALMPIDAVPIIVHAILATLAFALLGIIAGIFAERIEHVAALSNLVIAPSPCSRVSSSRPRIYPPSSGSPSNSTRYSIWSMASARGSRRSPRQTRPRGSPCGRPQCRPLLDLPACVCLGPGVEALGRDPFRPVRST